MIDNQGLTITTSSEVAAKFYNQAVLELLDYRTSAMATLKDAISVDSEFCMAHCLRGYMLMLISSFTTLSNAKSQLDLAKKYQHSASIREQAHVMALDSWIQGNHSDACVRWEAILFEFPLDIIALRLHHFVSFWMGRSQSLVSAPAAVLDAWKPGTINRGNVLGMLCFGLEEIGRPEQAERYGREAVDLNPDDLWAVHAVAHVLETQRRHKDGLNWINFPLNKWNDRNPFRGHVWWHRGLFLMDDGRYDDALALYDSSIYDTQSTFYLDIQNAAAFLARLEFRGINVSDRWEVLAQHAINHMDDHAMTFTDLHCVMALSRTRRFDKARDFINSMKSYASRNQTHSASVISHVGITACEGLLAFEERNYSLAISKFQQAKPNLREVGASNAQRDLLWLYAIEAAKRCNQQSILSYLQHEHNLLVDVYRLN